MSTIFKFFLKVLQSQSGLRRFYSFSRHLDLGLKKDRNFHPFGNAEKKTSILTSCFPVIFI